MLLTRVAIWFNGQLIRWAAYLQKKTMRYTPKKLKLFLVLFCLTFIVSSVHLIITSFGEKPQPFRIAPIQTMPLAERIVQQPAITEREFLRFRRLRLSLDSLAKTPSGKRRLDSILDKHPKLLDTLSLLENIYFNQHKKSRQ
jgi:hypothetical protein